MVRFKKKKKKKGGKAAFGYLADEERFEFQLSRFRESKTLAARASLRRSTSARQAEARRGGWGGGCRLHLQTSWAFVLLKRTSDFV